jgi:hypothetical protein
MATLLAAVDLEADVHHLAAASDANVIIIIIIIIIVAQFIQHSHIHRDIYEIPLCDFPIFNIGNC